MSQFTTKIVPQFSWTPLVLLALGATFVALVLYWVWRLAAYKISSSSFSSAAPKKKKKRSKKSAKRKHKKVESSSEEESSDDSSEADESSE